jgi:hypothetical protein
MNASWRQRKKHAQVRRTKEKRYQPVERTGQDRCNSTKEIVFLSKSHITTLVEVQ